MALTMSTENMPFLMFAAGAGSVGAPSSGTTQAPTSTMGSPINVFASTARQEVIVNRCWGWITTGVSSDMAGMIIKRASQIGITPGDFLLHFPRSTSESSHMSMHQVSQSSFNTTGTTASTWGGWYDCTLAGAT
jgi:hypothetical protein